MKKLIYLSAVVPSLEYISIINSSGKELLQPLKQIAKAVNAVCLDLKLRACSASTELAGRAIEI